jgi:hypothetical protein
MYLNDHLQLIYEDNGRGSSWWATNTIGRCILFQPRVQCTTCNMSANAFAEGEYAAAARPRKKLLYKVMVNWKRPNASDMERLLSKGFQILGPALLSCELPSAPTDAEAAAAMKHASTEALGQWASGGFLGAPASLACDAVAKWWVLKAHKHEAPNLADFVMPLLESAWKAATSAATTAQTHVVVEPAQSQENDDGSGPLNGIPLQPQTHGAPDPWVLFEAALCLLAMADYHSIKQQVTAALVLALQGDDSWGPAIDGLVMAGADPPSGFDAEGADEEDAVDTASTAMPHHASEAGVAGHTGGTQDDTASGAGGGGDMPGRPPPCDVVTASSRDDGAEQAPAQAPQVQAQDQRDLAAPWPPHVANPWRLQLKCDHRDVVDVMRGL